MSFYSPRPKKNRETMTQAIDSILNECQLLQRPGSRALTKNMNSHMSTLNSAYEEIVATDLVASNFQASRAYHNGKERLITYLDDKTKVKRALNKEKLRELLHQETIRSQSKKLTFDSLGHDEISYLLKKNKRKFGETYNIKGFSAKVSPVSSNLPSIRNSPKISPTNYSREGGLNLVISDMIQKKFGYLNRKKTLNKKQTLIRVKKRSSIRKKSVGDKIEVLEAAYLAPEFKKYNMNIGNKLKVERMMVQLHTKERRASMAHVQHDHISDDKNENFQN
jgi:hypothetical protein